MCIRDRGIRTYESDTVITSYGITVETNLYTDVLKIICRDNGLKVSWEGVYKTSDGGVTWIKI